VRDGDQRQPDDGEDRHEDHDLAGLAHRVVEADQRHETEHPPQDHEPGACKERAARVVDVHDPLDRVLAGARNQHVHAARCHERDADDERDRRQHGTDGPHGDDADASLGAIIRPSEGGSQALLSQRCDVG
jgi:hypothetical protein